MRIRVRLGRLILALLALLGLAALVLTGAWHAVVLFLWQHPMLSWLPVVAGLALGAVAGSILHRLRHPDEAPTVERIAGSPEVTAASFQAPPRLTPPEPAEAGRIRLPRPRIHVGVAALATFALLVYGFVVTLFFPPNAILDDFSYATVEELPASTQPRLLPRTAVRDDPRFAEAKEIHLVRDPGGDGLLWTGEWQAGTLSGPSRGLAVKRLEQLVQESEIVRAGFDRAVAGFGPTGVKWKAKLRHPLSSTQYPVLVPAGEREAFALMPYVGYRGFPFRRQYLKGVLVYHQDGTLEDLTPEEAARRPELAATGRIYPEKLARRQAEALARTDELEGEIVDGEGNSQPFLVSLDDERTVWLTVINEKGRDGGVKALVFTDSTDGTTSVWRASPDFRLVSTQDVIDDARSLPVRFTERRCCDSDGHSYTVTIREVVEPRLAFRDGKPYYLVSVVPTDELALPREIEYTLLIDASTGERVDEFRHVAGGPAEDERLQAFFEAG